MTVVGLACVRPAVQWSVLMPHNWAKHEQWLYHLRPLDAFFVAVEKYWTLDAPVMADQRVRVASRAAGVDAEFLRQGARIRLPANSLFQNVQPLLDVEVSDGDGFHIIARSIFEAAGYDASAIEAVKTMCVVQPFARLLPHGRLPFLIVLARWEHALQLWPAWPDRQWASAMTGLHFQMPAETAWTEDRIWLLMTDLRRWAERIVPDQFDDDGGPSMDQQLLESHVQCLYGLHSSLMIRSPKEEWGHRTRRSYGGEVLLGSILASRLFKNCNNLNDDLVKKVLFMLPSHLRSLALEASRNGVLQVPSWDSRLILLLDVACMLRRRKQFQLQPSGSTTKYLFADSSPQCGQDWLISKVRSIASADATKLLGVVATLVSDSELLEGEAPKPIADTDSDDEIIDEPCLAQRSIDRAALFRTLKESVSIRTFAPVALGLGRTKLSDKITTLAYAIMLDVGVQNMQVFLDSVLSITTDMGTELGLADYECSSVQSVLPSFVVDSEMKLDVMDPEAEQLAQDVSLSHLFRSCITITGMLHIFSNASKDLYKSLSCWESLYRSLKAIEKLVTNHGRLRKYVHTCVANTDYDYDDKIFQTVAPHLYDKRWGEVFKFGCWLIEKRRLQVLQATWDKGLYAAADTEDWESDEEDFCADEIGEAVNDIKVHANLNMVIGLDRMLQRISAWCERCPCHDYVQRKFRDRVPAEVVRNECGAETTSAGIACPFRGCRAPEVAAGLLLEVLQDECTTTVADLALTWRTRLGAEQWARLLGDFGRGKAHIVYIVTMKLDQWQRLPWLLCVLGHHDEQVARQGANHILKEYQGCTAEAANHRLTNRVCAEGGVLGWQLRAFAAGSPRTSLPELHLLSAQLAAIPCTERSIEAPHGQIKLNTAYKHCGPLSVAASVRFPEIDFEVMRYEEAWKEMVECIESARHMRTIPAKLSISAHPWLRALPTGRALQTHRYVSILTAVLYRCDTHAQYESTAQHRKYHESAKRKRLVEGSQAVPAQEPDGLAPKDAMLAHLAMNHFRCVAKEYELFSMPIGTPEQPIFVAPLHQHLASRPKCSVPASDGMVADCEMELDMGHDHHVEDKAEAGSEDINK